MAASASSRALSLYRRILRAAREWKGPPEERAYIETTAKHDFRQHRQLPQQEAQAKVSVLVRVLLRRAPFVSAPRPQ